MKPSRRAQSVVPKLRKRGQVLVMLTVLIPVLLGGRPESTLELIEQC